jgi:HPt (histidine-containing phosphotransfer) domain-containing protein
MPDSLGKPFTAQELWGCLLKYFTPVGTSAINEQEQLLADEKLHRQLCKNFLEDNQHTFQNLSNAIKAGDIELAHRIAHTLKGVAGLLGKNALIDAAYNVENLLKQEGIIPEEQMRILETELNFVMNELTQLLRRQKATETVELLDKTKALDLIRKLGPMLKIGDSDSLDFINDLRGIYGTEDLINRMEHFDFVAAYEIITLIIQKLEDGDDG